MPIDSDRYEIQPYKDIVDVWILNADFKKIGLIDDYTSLIWSKRYWEVGDFELYVQATEDNMALLDVDLSTTQIFVMRADNLEVMAVETIEISVDAEEGNFITASGRDLRKFLYQRVTTAERTYGELLSSPVTDESVESQNINVCYAIYQMANLECINPSDDKRKIPYLEASTYMVPGCDISAVTIDPATNVGEKIEEFATDFRFGWRCEWDGERIYLECYEGEDRSASVIFSPQFSNIENVTQTEDTSEDYYNSMILVNEDSDGNKTIAEFGDTTASGFIRHEEGFTGSADLNVSNTAMLRDLLYSYKLPQSYDVHYEYMVKTGDGGSDGDDTYSRVILDSSEGNPNDVDDDGNERTGDDYMSANPSIILTVARFNTDGWLGENDNWNATVSFLKYYFRIYTDEYLEELIDEIGDIGTRVTVDGVEYYLVDGTNDPTRRIELGSGRVRREYGWGHKDDYSYPWNLIVPAEYSQSGEVQTNFEHIPEQRTNSNVMQWQLPFSLMITLNDIFIRDRQMALAYSLVEEPMPTGSFEGSVIPFVQYEYRKDYNVGDKVSIRTDIGLRKDVRITEAVETFDRDGYTIEVKFSN